MEFKLYRQLYTNDMSEKKIKRYRKKIEQEKPALSLFLITLPISGDGILEIYPYTALLQDHFKSMDASLYVLGFADSHEEALQVAARLVGDMYRETGAFSVKAFISGNGD